jgi:hypothetical protein
LLAIISHYGIDQDIQINAVTNAPHSPIGKDGIE